jgi:membrane-bound metal-dependent hydrolase YbcI (DUF457 family)
MLSRTHIAIGVFAVLFFLPHVNYKWVFIPVVLIASLLPDIDSSMSTVGKYKVFRPFQLFMKHRGIIHSFTFCILLSVVFAFFYPVIAFPFFLGYSLHLIADAWTVEGIRPFWPMKDTTHGRVKVGGVVEKAVFFVFIILDLVFLIRLFVGG